MPYQLFQFGLFIAEQTHDGSLRHLVNLIVQSLAIMLDVEADNESDIDIGSNMRLIHGCTHYPTNSDGKNTFIAAASFAA